jgi:prolipoprotein diacylglyceryltransferase
MVMGGLIFGGLAMLFFGVFLILTSIFWILMLVDCIKRKFKKNDDKILWVIVIVFTQVIGALIYYFVVKRKAKR